MTNLRHSTLFLSAGIYCWAAILSVPVFAQAEVGAAETPQSKQQAQSVVNDLFGQEINRVSKTSNRDDDLELGKTMLDAAKTSADQPQLAVVILTQVVKLASRHPSGQSVAVEALTLLAKYDPEQRKVHQQQALVLLRREGNEAYLQGAAQFAQQNVKFKNYTAAGLQYSQAAQMAKQLRLKDEHEIFAAKADYYTSLSRVQKQIQFLEMQLKTKPDDGSTHERLAWLFTIELDDPAQATKHLENSSNQELMINVMMATQQVTEMPEDQALALGGWYEKQSKSSGLSSAGKASSLNRAKAYYGQYLKHAEAGLNRTRVELMIKKIDRELAGMNLQLVSSSDPQIASDSGTSTSSTNASSKTASKSKSKYINLLEKVKISRDAVAGTWKISDGKLITSGYGSSGLRFPVRIDGDYEMQLQFSRTEGRGTISIQIPVGEHTVSLMLQQTVTKKPVNYMSGFFNIDERGAADNGTGVKPGIINNGRRYTVGIKVVHLSEEKAAIGVTLNGQAFTQWRGNPSSLRPYSYFASAGGHGSPGVGIYSSSMVVYGAVLRMTKGEAKEMGSEEVAEGPGKAKGDAKRRLTDAQRREMDRRKENMERARKAGKRPKGRPEKR
jgi:hypothetical protein